MQLCRLGGNFLKNAYSECSSFNTTFPLGFLQRYAIVMSCLNGKTREYTLMSLLSPISKPVSSLTSRRNVSSRPSPLRIRPPGNHHSPLTGSLFRFSRSNPSLVTIIASADTIGKHFIMRLNNLSGKKSVCLSFGAMFRHLSTLCAWLLLNVCTALKKRLSHKLPYYK